MQILSSKEVQNRVAQGQSDFGLMADEISLDGIEHSTFADFSGVVVMPVGHALSRFKVIKPAQLAEVPFISLNPEDASRRRLEARMQQQGLALQIAAVTPYAASVCELAMHGLGVGLVNPITAFDYAQRGLVVRKLAIDIQFRCLLALPAGRLLSGAAKQLLSVMRKQLANDEQGLARLMAR